MTVGTSLSPAVRCDLLAERAAQGVRDVHLAALEHGQPRQVLRNDPPDQSLDRGRLAPVAVVRLQHQLHARVERRELVGTGADRSLLEALVADPLDVLLGDDPARPAGRRGVEGHEVRPGFLQPEPDPERIDDLDRGDFLLEQLGRRTLVALERELHVLGGERIAILEHDALAHDELVAEAVLGDGPGFGQRGRHGVARHGLHHRVVHGVEHLHHRDDPGVLPGIEPDGGQRDVHGPRHLRLRCRGAGSKTDQEAQDRDQDRKPPSSVHWAFSSGVEKEVGRGAAKLSTLGGP